ncbi:MAG TPA: hypothetical protein VF665_22110 [Longimicrobium sp.]|jgi:hypothetical protein|uniref:hypothetical protein n=1 Tax=Longimicrobium sp. TaxID=2029185 RepID=UPI002ED7EA60
MTVRDSARAAARPLCTLALLLGAALAPAAAAAQNTSPAPVDSSLVRNQVISILPIHAIFGFYAGEYERTLNQTVTLGLGASYFSIEDLRYSTVEAKLRYYPSGDPLQGLSFGVTAGPTMLSDREYNDSYDDVRRESINGLGIGIEIARSQILGVDRRFYYGYGAGAKRVFFNDSEDQFGDAQLIIPTARLSVGYAF